MASRRLVSKADVADYEARLRAACTKALDAQTVSVNATLRQYGLVGNLTAAASPPKRKRKASGVATGAIVAPLAWNAQQWAKNVNEHVAPVAREVAVDASLAAGALFVGTALWGMATSVESTTAAIIGRAVASGNAIGARLDAAGVADDDVVTGMQAVLDTAGDILGDVVGAMGQAAATMASQSTANALIAYNAPVYLSATKTWNNQGDDQVRETHQDVDDVQINELFSVGGDELTGPGDPSGSDEEVINCRCVPPWSRVSGVAVAASRRAFEGQLVHLTTARGHEFSASPEHPVLTGRGWVLAGFLNEGDEVLSDLRVVGVAGREPDVGDVPPQAHEVFSALAELAVRRGKRTEWRAVDLYGAPLDSHVEVVVLDDDLALYHDAPLAQQSRQLALASSHAHVGGSGPPSSVDRVAHPEDVGGSAPAGIDASTGQAVSDGPAIDTEGSRQRLLGLPREVAPNDLVLVELGTAERRRAAEPGSFGYPSQFDAHSLELLAHGVAVYPESFTDLVRRFPGQVAPDHVIDVHTAPYVGHVYDLTTVTGNFIADGIVVHNCWLTYDGLVPEGADIADEDQPSAA